jgi:hypothetical protein
MGVETNAILAINSLDRYVTNETYVATAIYCTWANNSNQLQVTAPAPNPLPRVGLFSPPFDIDGIPSRSQITAYNPTTNIITIDKLTTQANPAPTPPAVGVITLWDGQFRQGFFNDSLNKLYYSSAPRAPDEVHPPYGNDFSLQNGGALIYGYITKIAVAQVQLQYNVPTIVKGLNDSFRIFVAGGPANGYEIVIPYGFYYADELAATLQGLIRAADAVRFAGLLVTFYPRNGYVFNNSAANLNISIPSLLQLQLALQWNETARNRLLKTLQVLGLAYDNETPRLIQNSTNRPNFLYTPYVDIYSDVLTNYQKVKDTNTSIKGPKGLVARIYLSGVGSISTTGAVAETGRSVGQLGTEPFVMTADLNFPKIIRWTPDQTVTSIDFQLRDCYGDLLPGYDNGFFTEFQMTLLCTESDT